MNDKHDDSRAPEPVAWIDEFGNCFPLDARKYSIVGKGWRPLYTSAPTKPDAAPSGQLVNADRLSEFLQKRAYDSYSCGRLVDDLRELLTASQKPGETT